MRALPLGRVLLLLAPIACVGLFGRVYYTPDEPREASLVASMAAQANKALPEFDGRPFAEKPPLLYWLGAASVQALGASPAAARLPNLGYLLVTALALGALAGRAAGRAAGFATAIVSVTALQLYQVLIWLATDAPLLAGVAVALLGCYTGLSAVGSRERRLGYLGFNLGLAIAFFAKGFAGWLVPVPAFLFVVVLERRWRELFRAELWLGALLVVLAIGAWVYAVDRMPLGRESLKVMFWYNLVGRALPLDAPPEFAYATGHQNSFGKYLLELPLYLMPWIALALAATRRGVRGWRATGALGTAWRLGIGAIVPATILLSFAATARGVYYGPPALGWALLIGLYVGGAATALDRFDRGCWRVTGWLIALLAILLGAFVALMAFAPAVRDTSSVVLGSVALVAAAAAAWLGLTPPVAAAGSLPRYAFAFALVLTLVVAPLLRQLNDWQDLRVFAQRVSISAGWRPLIALGADETTVAMLSLYVPAAELGPVLTSNSEEAVAAAHRALRASRGEARILWLVPGGVRWSRADWFAFLGYGAARAQPRPAVLPPAGLGAVRLECVVSRPGGRSFAVLAAADAAPSDSTCR